MKYLKICLIFILIFLIPVFFVSSQIDMIVQYQQSSYDYLKLVLERNNIDNSYLTSENIKKVDLADSVNIIKYRDNEGIENFIVTKESVDSVKIDLGLSDCEMAKDVSCFEESIVRESAIIRFNDKDGNIRHLITNSTNIKKEVKK